MTFHSQLRHLPSKKPHPEHHHQRNKKIFHKKPHHPNHHHHQYQIITHFKESPSSPASPASPPPASPTPSSSTRTHVMYHCHRNHHCHHLCLERCHLLSRFYILQYDVKIQFPPTPNDGFLPHPPTPTQKKTKTNKQTKMKIFKYFCMVWWWASH